MKPHQVNLFLAYFTHLKPQRRPTQSVPVRIVGPYLRTYARTYDGDVLLLDRTHSVLNTDTASRRRRHYRRRHIAAAAGVYVARAQLEQRRL